MNEKTDDLKYQHEASLLHIEKQNEEIEKLQEHLKRAQSESAERRIKIKSLEAELKQTDLLRKKFHASEQIMKSANLPEIRDVDVAGLSVDEDGQVQGDFHYAPPSAKPDLPPASGGERPLTLDDVGRMSAAEVNSRWEEILALDSKDD